MKQYIVLSLIVVITICTMGYLFVNYKANSLSMQNNNKIYEDIYNKQINGSELATIINKVIDTNEKNNILKDEKGYYIQNEENSIIIEIKFKDSDNIFKAESIVKNGVENFIKLYSILNFKCTKIDYHSKTKYISYMYFEQI